MERLKQLIGSTAPLVAGLQPEDVLPDAPARFVRWATGLDKMLDDRAEAWDRFPSEILAAHQEKGAGSAGEEEDEDFLDVLLRLRREGADGLEFTDDRIKAMVKVIDLLRNTLEISQKMSSDLVLLMLDSCGGRT